MMKTQTSCGLRRDNVGSHQHHSKRETVVSAKPLGGVTSPRKLGEYGLLLELKDGHFPTFQVLIKVFFFFGETYTNHRIVKEISTIPQCLFLF